MATPNVVPRANCEGNIGTSLKKWTKMYTCTGFQIGADDAAGTFTMSNANNGSLIWEGATANAHEITMQAGDPDGDITYTLNGDQVGGPYANRSLQWTVEASGMPREWCTIFLSDETTPITTGKKVTWYAPYGMNISGIHSYLTTVGGGGGVTTVNIKEDGTDIFTTKLTIDAGEQDSTTAATAAVFDASSPYGNQWESGHKVEFFVDTVSGTGAECGLKLNVFYTRDWQ